jgi:hypothetical protein
MSGFLIIVCVLAVAATTALLRASRSSMANRREPLKIFYHGSPVAVPVGNRSSARSPTRR